MATTVKTPARSLGEQMLLFRRRLLERMKANSLAAELTFSQMETLSFIGLEGGKSMESIAEYFKIAPPSATALIKKMQKKGLVIGKRSTTDRRVVYIELASKTKKQLLALTKQKEACFKDMLKKLSSTDIKTFERIMNVLIEE